MSEFLIVTRSESEIRAHSPALNWTFTFNTDGELIDGFELIHRLGDDGYELARWALGAEVGERADLLLQD